MKALTICQPYAEMIACGEKRIENRKWFTRYRGPLAIHAGKSRDWLTPGDEREYPGMLFGAVIATARLVDCVPLEKLPHELYDPEHANGPYCWILDSVSRLAVPWPINGAQGLWEWTR